MTIIANGEPIVKNYFQQPFEKFLTQLQKLDIIEVIKKEKDMIRKFIKNTLTRFFAWSWKRNADKQFKTRK